MYSWMKEMQQYLPSLSVFSLFSTSAIARDGNMLPPWSLFNRSSSLMIDAQRQSETSSLVPACILALHITESGIAKSSSHEG